MKHLEIDVLYIDRKPQDVHNPLALFLSLQIFSFNDLDCIKLSPRGET